MAITTSRTRKRKKKLDAAFLRRLSIVALTAMLGVVILQDASGQKKRAEAEAIIAGTVFQSSGHLLRGAKVEVVAKGDSKAKGHTVTDAQGDFAIRVPAGRRAYTVTATAKGFEPAAKEVEVYESEKVRTNLILSPETKK